MHGEACHGGTLECLLGPEAVPDLQLRRRGRLRWAAVATSAKRHTFSTSDPRHLHPLLDPPGHLSGYTVALHCVIHLQTAAVCAAGQYEWGATARNPHRFHNPTEARTADKAGEQVWRAHRNFHFLPGPACARGRGAKDATTLTCCRCEN
eukprot:COSAG01_NODE_1978_length_8747_cov_87.182007_8_plen_150_part_00